VINNNTYFRIQRKSFYYHWRQGLCFWTVSKPVYRKWVECLERTIERCYSTELFLVQDHFPM